MKCPKCGENNSQIINEVTTSGKDFSAGKEVVVVPFY